MRLQRPSASSIVLWGASVVLAVLVVLPLARLLIGSVRTDQGALTVGNYLRVLQEAGLSSALVNTLAIGFGACVLSLVLGVPLAWFISRTNLPGRGVLLLTVAIAYMTPAYLGAIAYMVLAGPRAGWLNQLLVAVTGAEAGPLNIFSLTGITLVTTFNVFPYVVYLTSAALDSVDSSLEQSGRILGARQWRILSTITWPLVTPALLASTLLVFIHSISLFGSHALLGLPRQIYTLPTRIYSMFTFPPDYGGASSLAMSLVLLTVAALALQRWLVNRRSYVTVGGKGNKPDALDLGRWRWPAFLGCHAVLFFAVYLPIGVLVFVSSSQAWGLGLRFDNLTLANYQYVLFDLGLTQRAFRNSLYLGLVAATICCALGALIAYITGRLRPRGASLLDYLGMIPLGLPGIVLAVGLLLAWIGSPFPVYGTMLILLIAYLTRFIPLAVRSADSALKQIDPSLEEAARIGGATRLRGLADVTAPLMKGGLLAGWSLVFIQTVQELSATILLFTVGTETVAVAIYQRAEEGHFEHVAALSVLMLVVSLGVLAVVRRVTGATTGRIT
ncbi:MAG: ABC transporter permease subunit [Nitriliruptorales bacterium]|nr:ABC transporter permease subunit [Nitriliruptorales bacterium]